MTIHLIKDSKLTTEVFTAKYDFLTVVDETIQFKSGPESMVDFAKEDLCIRKLPEVLYKSSLRK